MNAAILIQPVQCLVNVIFLPVYLSFSDNQAAAITSTYSGFEFIRIELAAVILILTLVNIILCFTNTGCKVSCGPPASDQDSAQGQRLNQSKSKKDGPEKFISVELDEMEGNL